jgi:hypothetical protein
MQYQRSMAALLITPTLLLLTGCVSSKWVGPEEMPGKTVEAIVTADGDSVTFDWQRWATVERDTVYGYIDKQPYQVELTQVSAARVKSTNVTATVVLVVVAAVVAAAVVGGIALASWDY